MIDLNGLTPIASYNRPATLKHESMPMPTVATSANPHNENLGSESTHRVNDATSTSSSNTSTEHSDDEATGDNAVNGLTPEEQKIIQKLKSRDREVRAHEQAHAAVGGAYAGAPSFTYQRGPDGQNYAIGGEVSIDVSAVANDPEATIRKMQVVKRAALAPADPSSADRRIAQQAAAKEADARAQVLQQKSEEAKAARVDDESETTTDESKNETDGAKEISTAKSPTQPPIVQQANQAYTSLASPSESIIDLTV